MGPFGGTSALHPTRAMSLAGQVPAVLVREDPIPPR